MKKNKKILLTGILLLLTAVIAAAGIIFGIRLRVEDGVVYVGNSLLTPYAYALYEDHAVLEEYQGKEEEIVIPETILGKPVTEIGPDCFWDKEQVKTVRFSKTPYTYALYEDHAVLEEYSGKEEEVAIPETILGKPVTEIGFKCFSENEQVRTVRLSKTVTRIGACAFDLCKNLAAVTGGEKIKVIDDFAFDSCRKLEQVSIGDQLEEIGYGAFWKCEQLKTMDAQSNLVSIETSAFLDSGLESFAFNRDVALGNKVFKGTAWLANQPEEFVIYGDGDLIGYNGTEEQVRIPEGVKELKGSCFAETTAKEIYLPETVTTVGKFVFLDCTGVRVYIPDSVTRLGDEEGKNPIMDDLNAAITIITTPGSQALKHARKYEIPFEVVEGW